MLAPGVFGAFSFFRFSNAIECDIANYLIIVRTSISGIMLTCLNKTKHGTLVKRGPSDRGHYARMLSSRLKRSDAEQDGVDNDVGDGLIYNRQTDWLPAFLSIHFSLAASDDNDYKRVWS